MNIIATVGAAIQKLLGPLAEQVGEETNIIVRQRKFTCLSLARTFVLGFLQKPNASDEELAQVAVQCGADVTPQAVEQRYTTKLVNFLEGLFRRSLAVAIGSPRALAPILERFTQVIILDSTTVTLPDSMETKFRGCGGNYEGGKAALKLQVELDLRNGALSHTEVEPGRSPDSGTSRQKAKHPKGSLRVTDLGYFNVGVFAAMKADEVYFLSRLQFGTGVMLPNGTPVDNILLWLSKQPGPLVDVEILVGAAQRLRCRLIAWRLPEEQANRRRQKLRQEALSKRNKLPSAERLAWCDWTILVTSVPLILLTAHEAIVLYRARWQIELLFKRWKSQNLIADLNGSTDVRKMVRVWARLLGSVVQHWLLVGCAWGDPTRSWGKVCEAIRGFVGRLLTALDEICKIESVLADLYKVIVKTCSRNKRARPGTLELLNDVDLLDFRLT
jgi:hypothetical protein